jgi:Fe-S-cluster containining protein
MTSLAEVSTISMECRIGCGACCIAPSISTPMPGHPHGKKAGIRCAHLDLQNQCLLFGKPERPEVCSRFQATEEFCSSTYEQALVILTELERSTSTPPSGFAE